ncbi:MAG: sugar phosphate isomerase/epimerase [Maribacter sp.]|nr:sugar phosphate isomerase/epimerase [Maribacter sp.]MBT8314872.1 sugar phosphate isomerase/epimerase [Maribacter sp.]
MKQTVLTFILLFALYGYGQDKKSIQFFQTNWGNELSWDAFCQRTKASGYDGIEVWLPSGKESQDHLKAALEKYDLAIAFLNGTNKSLPFEEGLTAYKNHFNTLIEWKPVYINCHTGSDFLTFEQNKAFIDVANKISKASGIPIYHETHRGRFSYNLPDTNTYLNEITDLNLTLDISHWMVVHESLLQGKDELLKEVINKSKHIHARVGHAEGPQVNDPEAPEWKSALDRHMDIWETVIKKEWANGSDIFTITTEFGPPNYLPALPYTQIPVADQWKANVFIMKAIKERLSLE